MSGYYHKNILAYARREQPSANFLEKLDTSSYVVERSDSGEPALKVKKQTTNEWFWIDDPVNPVSEAMTHLPQFKEDEQYFVIMGMGLGHLLFEAVKRFPKSRFLVIEHDARIFKKAMEASDFTSYFENPNISFAVAMNPDILRRCFYNIFSQNDNDYYLSRLQLIKNNRIVGFSRNYYTAAGEILSGAVKTYWNIYVGNDFHDALKGLRHVLLNMRHLPRLINLEPYKDLFIGHTGIVVASGPSLNDRLDDLKKIQHRVPIVCADSALKKLLSVGIKPFGVTCLERDDINAELFKGYAIPHDVILFAPPLVKPETYENYPGPICFFFRHSYPFGFLPDEFPKWEMGLSCAHLAYQVLSFFGCKQIGLVGQDLAYDRNTGNSHFSGAIQFAHDQYAKQERISVPDNQGGVISTSRDWLMFRDFYEDLIAVNKDKNLLLNIIEKEKGLCIRGAHRLDPPEFFDSLQDESELPSFDVGIGNDYVRKRMDRYFKEWDEKRDRAIIELEAFSQDLENFRSSTTMRDYFFKKKSAFSRMSETACGLFEALARPNMRRFEAAAVSLWSDLEFGKNLGPFADTCQNIRNLLVQVLKETR